MASIDYEAEYNNRARWPEHVDIFAGWMRDAAAYRDESERAGRAELGLRYGSTPRQTIDLFSPTRGARPQALAIFIHGGFWRSLDPSSFSHMARGLNTHGVTVGMIGYDLCPQVTLPTIIDEVRQACLFLWRRLNLRMIATGHSAGGHLAACMLATDWKALAPDAPDDLVPACCAISGVYELEPLLKTSINDDLRLDAATAEKASPILWPLAPGRIADIVVGGVESNEFLRQSRILAEAWRQDEAQTRLEEVPGANHYTVLDPLDDPNSDLVRRVVALARLTRPAPV
jgi:arylformamidase